MWNYRSKKKRREKVFQKNMKFMSSNRKMMIISCIFNSFLVLLKEERKEKTFQHKIPIYFQINLHRRCWSEMRADFDAKQREHREREEGGSSRELRKMEKQQIKCARPEHERNESRKQCENVFYSFPHASTNQTVENFLHVDNMRELDWHTQKKRRRPTAVDCRERVKSSFDELFPSIILE